MGSFRYKLCSRLCYSTAIWTMLVVAASADEIYDDMLPRTLDDEILYQENTDLDTHLPDADQKINGDKSYSLGVSEGNRDALLYNFIQAMRLRNDDPRSTLEFIDDIDLSQKMPVPTKTEVMVTKRFANAQKRGETMNGPKPKSGYPSQQRWKTKKGKGIGSQMICYFKLCAFRAPY